MYNEERTCKVCGLMEHEHNVRHPFVEDVPKRNYLPSAVTIEFTPFKGRGNSHIYDGLTVNRGEERLGELHRKGRKEYIFCPYSEKDLTAEDLRQIVTFITLPENVLARAKANRREL